MRVEKYVSRIDVLHILSKNQNYYDKVTHLSYVEVKRGYWKFDIFDENEKYPYECSLCGNYSSDRWNFCPWCGADGR